MVGASDLASRHTKLATTRGLQSIPALALSSNLLVCARAHVLEYVPHAAAFKSRLLKEPGTVRLILLQVNEDLSGFDLVP